MWDTKRVPRENEASPWTGVCGLGVRRGRGLPAPTSACPERPTQAPTGQAAVGRKPKASTAWRGPEGCPGTAQLERAPKAKSVCGNRAWWPGQAGGHCSFQEPFCGIPLETALPDG